MDHLVPNIGSIRERLSAARSLRFPFRSPITAWSASLLFAFETLIATHSGRQAHKFQCGGALGSPAEPRDYGALRGERSDGMMPSGASAVSKDHLVCRAVEDEVTA